MNHKKRRKRHIHQPPCKHEFKSVETFSRFGGDIVGQKKCAKCGYELFIFNVKAA